jgi:hypothetical protein
MKNYNISYRFQFKMKPDRSGDAGASEQAIFIYTDKE